MITVCSIMRNSSTYLGRYFTQLGDLHKLFPNLRVVIGEGDHVDETSTQLHLFAPNYCEIIDVTHGGPRFGSIDHPARWDQIAGCVRAVLDKVGDPGQALIWMESDLIWDTLGMAQLIVDAMRHVPAVAPMAMAQHSSRFYDTWGFRNNGGLFNGTPPYWNEPVERQGEFVKIDSCGSCFVAGPECFPWLETWTGHWPATLGGNLWLDPRVKVQHP